ncbi:serine hydrolase domain-containing protein [Actinoplanes solisilvae]|uniref:serine hydrolase domain-containing protein n=1 Tax=Actinoplanes solisilvae TaxID=2486853 RepID=UPI000FD7BD85|nr:serine hydrolase domain-containing protein [Actinoplanes solisilvae]
MTTLTKRTALVVAATVVLTGSGAVSAAAAPPAHDVSMREVAARVLSVGVPGYVARIDDGRRVRTTVAGLADRETGRPLNGREQFEVGSNTKTFMAVLALQLVDRGRLKLDRPVGDYLPGVVPDGDHITVRMLLNHTSGLFSYTSDPAFFERMNEDPQHVYTERELLDVAFGHAPNFAPGQGWSYSNTNYTLIGMILQRLTGQSLPDLVERRIAKPLGLDRTYFADPRATHTGRGYAHGYAVSFAGAQPVHTDVSEWPIGGWGGAAGAIISTPEDLARFFEAVLGGELFSRAQLAQMRSTVDIPESFGIKGGYGLGLIRIDSVCGTVWGHGGDTMGHHSTAVASADGRRTAVTDATAEPVDSEPNAGAERFYRVVMAADTATICHLLNKPVPAAVADALRG